MKLDSAKDRILNTPKTVIKKSVNSNLDSSFGSSNRLATLTKINYRNYSKINKSDIDADSVNFDNISEDFSIMRKKDKKEKLIPILHNKKIQEYQTELENFKFSDFANYKLLYNKKGISISQKILKQKTDNHYYYAFAIYDYNLSDFKKKFKDPLFIIDFLPEISSIKIFNLYTFNNSIKYEMCLSSHNFKLTMHRLRSFKKINNNYFFIETSVKINNSASSVGDLIFLLIPFKNKFALKMLISTKISFLIFKNNFWVNYIKNILFGIQNFCVFNQFYLIKTKELSLFDDQNDDEEQLSLRNTQEHKKELDTSISQNNENIIDPKYRYNYYLKCHYKVDEKFGLVLTNKKLISNQRSLATYLLKKFGSNILSGKSIMNVSLPVTIFEPISVLHLNCRSYEYASCFLERASYTANPLERMKLVIGFSISMMNRNITQEKPFNPVLGETLQCFLGNYQVFGEQISHHPPISFVNLHAKEFDVFTLCMLTAATFPNSATAQDIGGIKIVFRGKYPSTITFNTPRAIINGLIIGKRTFQLDGRLIYKDEVNKLYAAIEVNPYRPKGLFSVFKTIQKRPDYCLGVITYDQSIVNLQIDKILQEKKKMISFIEGYWMDQLKIDNEVIFDIIDFSPTKYAECANCLKSDSKFREDLIYLAQGNKERAQEEKERLEDIQRNDRELRKKYTK